jgi:hypothetical protein
VKLLVLVIVEPELTAIMILLLVAARSIASTNHRPESRSYRISGSLAPPLGLSEAQKVVSATLSDPSTPAL